MHPLDSLAQLDLARHGHDRDRSLHEAIQRRAAPSGRSLALRLRGLVRRSARPVGPSRPCGPDAVHGAPAA